MTIQHQGDALITARAQVTAEMREFFDMLYRDADTGSLDAADLALIAARARAELLAQGEGAAHVALSETPRFSLLVAVNDDRKLAMARKIEAAFGGVKGKTIAVLGLTFKPNTDDMRDTPSLVILPYLQKAGAVIRAFAPEGHKEAAKHLQVDYRKDTYDALDGADGVVILTEWNEFRALDFGRVKAALKTPLMVDLRNIYRPGQMADAGFTYVSVGRPAAAR